jgi:hypothetical protein
MTLHMGVQLYNSKCIQVWGCTKPSNTKIIWRLQSKVLHPVTNAPWYVSNFTLHGDLQIAFVIEEIHRLSTLYHQSIIGHNNRLTYLLMELNPSWGTANCAATWQLPSILWNSKVQYHVHKSPPLVPILRYETVATWPTTTRRWRKWKSPPFLFRACQNIISGWLLYSRHLVRTNLVIASYNRV